MTLLEARSPNDLGDPQDPRTPSAPVARLERVSRTYSRGSVEVHALRELDFRLAPRELVAITGPSGCGKSTLLNVVSGVDRADAGLVEVCGQDLRTATESDLTLLRRRKIGVVFQDFQLMPNLTAAENVALPLSLDGRVDADRVRSLLERVGLGHRLDHYPSELSGGEQQRVAQADAPSSTAPPSSSPTNRPATSTRRTAAPSSRCCSRSDSKKARHWSSRRTTSASPNAPTAPSP